MINRSPGQPISERVKAIRQGRPTRPSVGPYVAAPVKRPPLRNPVGQPAAPAYLQKSSRPQSRRFIASPTEDSLNQRKINYLSNHNWEWDKGNLGKGWYKRARRSRNETEPNHPPQASNA